VIRPFKIAVSKSTMSIPSSAISSTACLVTS
jgi:hypothetical protein